MLVGWLIIGLSVKQKPKILVIDGDENILSTFANYLRKKNYTMTGVNNSEKGIKEIKQQNFQLLITDIRENPESGKNFISRVKEIQGNLNIIAITSYPEKIIESDLKNYGADYLFIKPLELDKLNEAIESCLCQNTK